MYGEYPEEVLKEGREMPEGFLPYDGRFVTQRFHVGNNCKCQLNNTHPGHHQTPYEFVPDPPGNGNGARHAEDESVDLAEARKASHVRHKHRDE